MKREQHYVMNSKIRSLLYQSIVSFIFTVSLLTIGMYALIHYAKGAFVLPLVLYLFIAAFLCIGLVIFSAISYARWLEKRVMRPYAKAVDLNLLSEMEQIAYASTRVGRRT